MKMISRLLVVSGMFLVGCGEAPLDDGSSSLDASSCTDVGAAQNCTYSPGHNGPSPTVTCQANRGGVVVPVVGCTIDLLAAPGVLYKATCVAACQTTDGNG